MFLKHLNQPILYEGRKKSEKYFEGWYFKQVSADLNNSISVIPGITKDPYDTHAFIQTIVNLNINSEPRLETHYYKFLMDDFKYNDEYRFASYNHSKLIKINYTKDSLDVTILKNKLKLQVSAKMHEGGILKAPKNGTMDKVIKEELSGIVDVKLIKKSGELIFKGIGNCCGIELVKSLQNI